MPLGELFGLLALGLVAGIIGGLVGVGGSIIIIPVLTVIMGRSQHLSQATAMIINCFVAAPALVRHHRAGAVRWNVVSRMLVAGLVFILIGVELSNILPVDVLKKSFGAFLLYTVLFEIREIVRNGNGNGNGSGEIEPPRLGWGRMSIVGGAMGLIAGLLGIGGGPIAVPMLHRYCRIPLREAIAATSAVMCVTAFIGAIRKNLALTEIKDSAGNFLDPIESLTLAAALAPTAMVGALIGAGLTHSLPLKWVRLAFIVLLAWASLEMLGVL